MPVDRAGANPNVPAPFSHHEQHRTTEATDPQARGNPVHQPPVDEPFYHGHRQAPAAQIHGLYLEAAGQGAGPDQAGAQHADDAISRCRLNLSAGASAPAFLSPEIMIQAKIYPPTPTNLRHLAAVLRRGGLVAMPTETVYGLAANALDAQACRAIFQAKRRPANDPLIVHVLDLAHAEQLAEFNDVARKLARRFWPGPLTLVLPKKPCVPGIVTAGGPTVANRAPPHPPAPPLFRTARGPPAAPPRRPHRHTQP